MRKKRPYKIFTDEEREFIEKNYLVLSDHKIAEILGRSSDNIRKQRQIMGLSKRRSDVKKALAEAPIIIWVPRDVFDNHPINLNELKLGE